MSKKCTESKKCTKSKECKEKCNDCRNTFCSDKFKYHDKYFCDSDLSQVTLRIESRTLGTNVIEFSYIITNIGTTNFCKDYMICSKLFGTLINEMDQNLISSIPTPSLPSSPVNIQNPNTINPGILFPQQQIVFVKEYQVPISVYPEIQLQIIEEIASVYFKVTPTDIIRSNEFELKVSDFGITFKSYVSGSVRNYPQRLFTITFTTVNFSMYDGKNIVLEYFVPKREKISFLTYLSTSIPNIPRINERGNVETLIPIFPSRRNFSFTIQFRYERVGALTTYYVPVDVIATSGGQCITQRIEGGVGEMVLV